MPIDSGKYKSPKWVNNSAPYLNAAELQAMTDTIENNQKSSDTNLEELEKCVRIEKVGQPNGVASLGKDGKIPSDQLPDISSGETVCYSGSELSVVCEDGKDYCFCVSSKLTLDISSGPRCHGFIHHNGSGSFTLTVKYNSGSSHISFVQFSPGESFYMDELSEALNEANSVVEFSIHRLMRKVDSDNRATVGYILWQKWGGLAHN